MTDVTAVIAAGGKGTRMGAEGNKVFAPLLGKEMIAYTLDAFESSEEISDIVIVTAACDMSRMREVCRKYGYTKVVAIVEGGAARAASVYAGLRAALGEIVAIHDGARALITHEDIKNSIEDCIKYGAAAVGMKCKDTLKSVDESGFIRATVDRESTYTIMTPQVFYTADILAMHERAAGEGYSPTDDCAMCERYGKSVKVTDGRYDNIKLTTPDDMAVAENILKRRMGQCE